MFTTTEDALIESLTSDGFVQEFMQVGLKGIQRGYANVTSGNHTLTSGAYWVSGWRGTN